ncbi:MAG: formate dehydrogenase accessory sulfurtransferase FdhD [Oscillospiraceae bacterium]|nr:formate dehydrogenase accessory sulfurtransferase FdhD [Oscillospiraceae bacterium]
MKVTDLFENRPDEKELVLTSTSAGVSCPVNVVLNEEHWLDLYCGDTLAHSFVCSPCALGELCVGWLFTEGYPADSVEVSRDGHTATVQGASLFPGEPEKLCPEPKVSASTQEMLQLFHKASDKYSRSHGIHECVIKGDGWHVLRTDIGRHNAIDKAVGAAILAGHDLEGAVMFSSGRINVQTVKKAARCKIGCLMSKAVITGDALILAQELGLKVLFSVKESGYICG